MVTFIYWCYACVLRSLSARGSYGTFFVYENLYAFTATC